jgi:hypothetical protein
MANCVDGDLQLPGGCYWDQLDDATVARILRWLNGPAWLCVARRVCRRWARIIAQDHALWTQLTAQDYGVQLQVRQCGKVRPAARLMWLQCAKALGSGGATSQWLQGGSMSAYQQLHTGGRRCVLPFRAVLTDQGCDTPWRNYWVRCMCMCAHITVTLAERCCTHP